MAPFSFSFVSTLNFVMEFYTEKINTPQGRLNFYFNRIFTAEGDRYHISVIGKGGTMHAFNVYEAGDKWKLAHPVTCPQWIVEFEDEISRSIEQHKARKDN